MCAPLANQGGSSVGKLEVLNDDFFMFRAKVEMCPRQDVHSYSACPYLHPNEQAKRRDPLLFKYDSIFCYDLHNTNICKRGANCPYSHNIFEYFLHPSRYRTRMCEFGEDCKRELCFFAHNQQQLRPRSVVKTYSGGRRNSRQCRAAAVARVADALGDLEAVTSSPRLQFLQVPALPCASTSSQAQAVVEVPEAALAGLTIQPASSSQQQPQDPSMGPVLVPHTSAAVLGSAAQLQPQPQPSMVLVQHRGGGGAPAVVQSVAYESGTQAVEGYQVLQSYSSSSPLIPAGSMACLPVSCLESHAPTAVASCAQAPMQDTGNTTAGTCFTPIGLDGQPQAWAAVLAHQQVQIAEPQKQYVLLPQQDVEPTQLQFLQPQRQLQALQLQQQLQVLQPQQQLQVPHHHAQQMVQLMPVGTDLGACALSPVPCFDPGMAISADGVPSTVLAAAAGCSSVGSASTAQGAHNYPASSSGASTAMLVHVAAAPPAGLGSMQQGMEVLADSSLSQGMPVLVCAGQQQMFMLMNPLQ